MLLIAVLALCMGTLVAACGDDEEEGETGAQTEETAEKVSKEVAAWLNEDGTYGV